MKIYHIMFFLNKLGYKETFTSNSISFILKQKKYIKFLSI